MSDSDPFSFSPHHSKFQRSVAVSLFSDTLAALALNIQSEGLKDTPRRWVNALLEMTEGYGVNVQDLLKVSFDGQEYDQVVTLSGISFVSLCEHHLLPFIGQAHVAYLPRDNRVVGLSKLARVVEAFARRLQLQERMTQQIAAALWDNLKPHGVAVIVEAEHQCMACRGIRKPGAVMRTSALRGSFMDNADVRAEVFGLLLR